MRSVRLFLLYTLDEPEIVTGSRIRAKVSGSHMDTSVSGPTRLTSFVSVNATRKDNPAKLCSNSLELLEQTGWIILGNSEWNRFAWAITNYQQELVHEGSYKTQMQKRIFAQQTEAYFSTKMPKYLKLEGMRSDGEYGPWSVGYQYCSPYVHLTRRDLIETLTFLSCSRDINTNTCRIVW